MSRKMPESGVKSTLARFVAPRETRLEGADWAGIANNRAGGDRELMHSSRTGTSTNSAARLGAMGRTPDPQLSPPRADEFPQAQPVETRPGVGFARRCDVGMTDDFKSGICGLQRLYEPRELPVLNVGERLVVSAFEFDADRIVVAVRAPPPRRFTCMPGAFRARHELDHFAVAAHQKMRRNLELRDAAIIRM